MLSEGPDLQHPDFPIYCKYLAKAIVYFTLILPQSINENMTPLGSSYRVNVILIGTVSSNG